MNRIDRRSFCSAALALTASGIAGCSKRSANTSASLLNVSYDPTRELYRDMNVAFAKQWRLSHGQHVRARQSHGGSAKQARSVIDGLDADVVTLALAFDIDAIARAGLIARDWQARLPNNSTPYTSRIVFVVRKGNPKKIQGWADLSRPDIRIVTANPKTSGGARWTYLSAWGWSLLSPGGDASRAREYVRAVYTNVVVLDPGARGATTSFAQNGIGDVLLTWENEAHLLLAEGKKKGAVDLVVPQQSILAEPSVAWVDRNVERHGSRSIAEGYLRFLYEPDGQEIAARHHFRPRSTELLEKYAFPPVTTFTIDEAFGGWDKTHREHFADGATFDQLLAARR